MKNKKLEMVIKSCSQCPYIVEVVFDDVGFGWPIYECEKLNKPEKEINGDVQETIWKYCPLNDA